MSPAFPVPRISLQTLELHTLGVVDLRDSSGDVCVPVLSQAKRLALLVYLTVAAPRGFHRRDSLVALFWPDLDHAHARNALCQAIHMLRRFLGKDVVVGRGAEDLGVDSQLWCDVAAFEDAIESGRYADALQLYRGEFLEGLHVSRAPEFDDWQGRERDRIRRRALEAAWSLADRTARGGQPERAAHWLRLALSISPTDERSLRRLIHVLDQMGNRIAAARAYEDFAKRLQREHDLTPAPETQMAIDAVRTR